MCSQFVRSGVAVALFTVLVATGCGGSAPAGTFQVTGVVSLDGKPLQGASVAFLPKDGGVMASAETDASGKFTVNAMGGNNTVTVAKAAPPGATVDPYATVPAEGPPPTPPEGSVVPAKYADPKTSNLTVVVASGMAELKLDLSSK